ncbi:975_t:CDS:2 [Entrophospora sp. SA101]|nr:975_t:CDS:2 [Entrophospora sp. SA101]
MLSSTLVNCICGAKILLDRPYDERLFERHLKIILDAKEVLGDLKIVGVIAKESLLDEYQEEINKKNQINPLSSIGKMLAYF